MESANADLFADNPPLTAKSLRSRMKDIGIIMTPRDSELFLYKAAKRGKLRPVGGLKRVYARIDLDQANNREESQ